MFIILKVLFTLAQSCCKMLVLWLYLPWIPSQSETIENIPISLKQPRDAGQVQLRFQAAIFTTVNGP
jgi:hypothetical protein